MADLEAIKAEYPQLAHLIDHPEIGPILAKAHDEGWPADKFQAAIMATQWWRTTAATQRQWDEKSANDPQTAAREVSARSADLHLMFMNMGGDPNNLASIWGSLVTNTLRDGMSENEMRLMLGSYIRYRSGWDGAATMQFQATAGGVRQMASEYLIPVGESEVEGMVRALARGEIDENGVRARYREMAKVARPHMAAALDAGGTVRSIMAPIVNTAAQSLEISPDLIDLSKPKWAPLLDARDPVTGDPRSMTAYEAGVWVRNMPEWARTANAQEAANSMTTGILKTMGRI